MKTTSAGTGDGTSWTNASSNLQQMIDESFNGDTVFVAEGTYLPTKIISTSTSVQYKSLYLRTVLLFVEVMLMMGVVQVTLIFTHPS